jgi:nitroimidazol reductase NimA-like FMN-containing flavoprotein (pyridoxamine 5'-phosphate oxidase superfamily)
MRPFKLPKMDKEEIEELLDQQCICRIAFHGEVYPYLAPFQYVKIGGSLYFHFTDYGRKMKILERDSRVCVGVENLEPDMSEYKFVVLRGNLKRVDDPEERAEAIGRLAEEGRRALSKNFLAAHGFKKESGWSALSPQKPMVIFKLSEIIDTIGLKSPE